MSRVYFDYQISQPSQESKDLASLVHFETDRYFDEKSKTFRYRLQLIVARNITKFDGVNDDYELPLVADIKGKYLFVLHGDVNSFSKNDISFIKNSNKETLFQVFDLSINEQGNAIANDKYRNLKCVFELASEEDITGVGMFGFSDSREVEPSEENRFYYYTKFYKKLVIRYSAERKKSSLKLTFKNLVDLNEARAVLHPKTSHAGSAAEGDATAKHEPQTMNTAERAKAKTQIPHHLEVRISYNSKITYQRGQLLDDIITIPSGKKKTFKTTLDLSKNPPALACEFFAPIIINEPFNNYFIFERVEKKSAKTKYYRANLKNKVKLCPYCSNIIVQDKNRTGLLSCQGEPPGQIYDVYMYDRPVKNAHFCQDFVSSVLSSDEVEPPKFFIPEHYLNKEVKNTIVGLLGLPASGKSVFLSSILGLQNGNDCAPTYLNRFLKHFKTAFEFEENGELIFNSAHRRYDFQKVKSQYFNLNENSNTQLSRFEQFRIDAFNETYQRTPTGQLFYPFILRAPSTNLVIKDISGEDAKAGHMLNDPRSNLLNRADAYIVLISVLEPAADFQDTINRIIREENATKPIAICLSKFDMVDLRDFEPNAACLLDDTFPLLDIDTYKDSALSRNIEQSSEELKAYIKEKQTRFPLDNLLGTCKNVRFFALSSIGESRAVVSDGKSDEFNNILYYNTPFRAELPLLWILNQVGIIE